MKSPFLFSSAPGRAPKIPCCLPGRRSAPCSHVLAPLRNRARIKDSCRLGGWFPHSRNYRALQPSIPLGIAPAFRQRELPLHPGPTPSLEQLSRTKDATRPRGAKTSKKGVAGPRAQFRTSRTALNALFARAQDCPSTRPRYPGRIPYAPRDMAILPVRVSCLMP